MMCSEGHVCCGMQARHQHFALTPERCSDCRETLANGEALFAGTYNMANGAPDACCLRLMTGVAQEPSAGVLVCSCGRKWGVEA